ncbi:3'-5' exonuclease [Kosmotoga pacifica]|uniref:DNA polymerase III subunit epsilon n=1 Tax=Kosmotoga pacifica TaxID=1330330 RepID=A0A0G2ZES1_9BACT|nr:3'-5' exonuclease [Kosmotoga pacifica]AKI97333.1 DNA polymerase III subunit epsilon [Kosmotoga pacifica]
MISLEFVVIDTETTGLSPYQGARLIEVAGLVVEEDWKINIDKHFHSLINPGVPIPVFITRLTGINSRMVRSAPPAEEVLPAFFRFLSGRTLVIQNAPFDLSFLNHYAKKLGFPELTNPVIDTIWLSRRLFCGRHNLDLILARLNILAEDRHRALGDVILTARAFVKMAAMIGKEEVIKMASQKVSGRKPPF